MFTNRDFGNYIGVTLTPGSMKYDRQIHNRSLVIKALLGKLTGWVPLMQPVQNDLVVVSYHGTQKRFLNNFVEQVKFFKDTYNIITPAQLSEFFENRLESSSKPYLLFSFDDGLRSNLYVAEILYKYGIRTFFFVVPEFINCSKEKQRAFFLQNICPMDSWQSCTSEDTMALSWDELKGLVAIGHEMGSHSASHVMKTSELDDDSRYHEIVDSRCMLADGLDLSLDKIRAFCGPLDSLQSVGRKEMTLIKDNYKFFFSTFPGSNNKPKNPYFIKRVHIEDFWMFSTVRFVLSNLERLRWKHKINLFKNVCQMEKACNGK